MTAIRLSSHLRRPEAPARERVQDGTDPDPSTIREVAGAAGWW